jgi:menaquinone-dependent protoporphyrinogen oxidase
MSKFLIIYSTTDGHTKKICQRIKNFLTDGNLVELLSLEDSKKVDLSNFEKIIIGASIRYGKHSKELYKFINFNKDILDQKKSAFAGKVDYPNYNFFDKYIIKFIMFITKGPTDTSQSYEFTDWSKVDDFSEEFRNNY